MVSSPHPQPLSPLPNNDTDFNSLTIICGADNILCRKLSGSDLTNNNAEIIMQKYIIFHISAFCIIIY